MTCELSARITPGDVRCLSYLKSGSSTCMCCESRPGLKKVEVVEMAESKCRHEGCDKRNFINGYCCEHARGYGHGAALEARYDKMKAQKAAKKAGVIPATAGRPKKVVGRPAVKAAVVVPV